MKRFDPAPLMGKTIPTSDYNMGDYAPMFPVRSGQRIYNQYGYVEPNPVQNYESIRRKKYQDLMQNLAADVTPYAQPSIDSLMNLKDILTSGTKRAVSNAKKVSQGVVPRDMYQSSLSAPTTDTYSSKLIAQEPSIWGEFLKAPIKSKWGKMLTDQIVPTAVGSALESASAIPRGIDTLARTKAEPLLNEAIRKMMPNTAWQDIPYLKTGKGLKYIADKSQELGEQLIQGAEMPEGFGKEMTKAVGSGALEAIKYMAGGKLAGKLAMPVIMGLEGYAKDGTIDGLMKGVATGVAMEAGLKVASPLPRLARIPAVAAGTYLTSEGTPQQKLASSVMMGLMSAPGKSGFAPTVETAPATSIIGRRPVDVTTVTPQGLLGAKKPIRYAEVSPAMESGVTPEQAVAGSNAQIVRQRAQGIKPLAIPADTPISVKTTSGEAYDFVAKQGENIKIEKTPSGKTVLKDGAEVPIPPSEARRLDQQYGKQPTQPVKTPVLRTETPLEAPKAPEMAQATATAQEQAPAQKPLRPGEEGYSRMVEAISTGMKKLFGAEARKKLLTKVEDSWYPVFDTIRKYETSSGKPISDEANPHQKHVLMVKRIKNESIKVRDKISQYDSELRRLADESGVKPDEFRKELFTYLQARHAPERNASLYNRGLMDENGVMPPREQYRAAGMTDAEAIAHQQRISQLPHFDKISALAEDIVQFNNDKLKLAKEYGLISGEEYNRLRNEYPNHVPLHREFIDKEGGEVAPPEYVATRGMDVRTSGLKKAVGSEAPVKDILENIFADYGTIINRGEKNIVDNSTYKLAKTINDPELFKELPPNVGNEMLFKNPNDPSILKFRENGVPKFLQIKDPMLAGALKDINREYPSNFFKFITVPTKIMARLATTWNPDFPVANKIRDIQEIMPYLISLKNEGGFRQAAKVAAKGTIPEMKGIFDWLAKRDTPAAREYQDMINAGGATSDQFTFGTREKVAQSYKAIQELNEAFGETTKGTARQIASKAMAAMDGYNRIFEDSTRLAVYKRALASGASKERAAFLAAEASINFDKMGTASPIINSMWMFSNASMQGTFKLVRAMKNNPKKVLPYLALSTFVPVALTSKYNDTVDKDWRDKVSKWDRYNGLNIVLPSTDGKFRYVSIPTAWGLKPFLMMANFAMGNSGQNDTTFKKVMSLAASTFDSYNPIGGTSNNLAGMLVPTAVKPMVEVRSNMSWAGNKIKPDYNANLPEHLQYYDSLKDNAAGRMFIKVAKGLSDVSGGQTELSEKGAIDISPADMNYLFQQYTGGVGKFGARVASVVSNLAQGKVKETLPRDVPLAGRFYRSRTAQEIGDTRIDQQAVKDLSSRKAAEDWKVNDKAKEYARKMSESFTKTGSVDPKIITEVQSQGVDFANKVATHAQKQSENFNIAMERVKQLPIKGGYRAAAIYKSAMKLGQDEGASLMQDLWNAGVLNQDVWDQIQELHKQQQ